MAPMAAYCGAATPTAPVWARARAAAGRGRPAPSTTSLRLGLTGVGRARVARFAETWLRARVERGGGLWGVPFSIEGGDVVYFGGDGGVRGVLRVAVTGVEDVESGECSGDAGEATNVNTENHTVELRVESASRFLNRGGESGASLPGERGVVRALFRGVIDEFGPEAVELLYKPPHIRLGAVARAQTRRARSGGFGDTRPAGFADDDSARYGVVMVGRVRGEAVARVAAWAERWGGRVFSGEARFFGSDGIGCKVIGDGEVSVRCGRLGAELIFVRVRRRAAGAAAFAEVAHVRERARVREVGGTDHGDEGVVVTATTNAPEGIVVRRVLARLARDLQGAFADCRIHYPR